MDKELPGGARSALLQLDTHFHECSEIVKDEIDSLHAKIRSKDEQIAIDRAFIANLQDQIRITCTENSRLHSENKVLRGMENYERNKFVNYGIICMGSWAIVAAVFFVNWYLKS